VRCRLFSRFTLVLQDPNHAMFFVFRCWRFSFRCCSRLFASSLLATTIFVVKSAACDFEFYSRRSGFPFSRRLVSMLLAPLVVPAGISISMPWHSRPTGLSTHEVPFFSTCVTPQEATALQKQRAGEEPQSTVPSV
jgi:hypothetical protein